MAEVNTLSSLPLLDWVAIPAGQVARQDGSVDVAPFSLASAPLTNAQFEAFVEAGGYKAARWWKDLALAVRSPRASDWGEAKAPKLQICWLEAVAFCRWLSAEKGAVVRLPTAFEWQWAASAGADRVSRPSAPQANLKEGGLGRTNLVTKPIEHSHPFRLGDMIGNVGNGV